LRRLAGDRLAGSSAGVRHDARVRGASAWPRLFTAAPPVHHPRYIGTIDRMARRGESIELAVLGLLHEGPLHGYELRRRLNLLLGWGLGRVLSYGTLYPALKKMSRSQLISEDTSTPAPV